MPIPKKVKVIVYSGRNLKAKKGHGEPLAWVVFGFGKDKRCTKQRRDRAPSWNEESEFTVTDSKHPLKFKVKDKDGILGQVLIPLSELPTDEHCLKWVELEPQGNGPLPGGEICVDCWIEDVYDYEEEEDIPKYLGQNLKLKSVLGKLSKSGLLGRSSEDLASKKNKSSIRSGSKSMKGSVSMEFLGSGSKRGSIDLRRRESESDELNYPTIVKVNLNEQRRTPSPLAGKRRNELATVLETTGAPVVEMVTPTRGPVSGGTLVQISGQNLGKSANDIITLMIGSADCLPSLEYYSPCKIICTTPAGEGLCPIIITTRSGGTCTSKVKYHFRRSEDKASESHSQKENGTLEPSKGMVEYRKLSMVEMGAGEDIIGPTDDTRYYDAERDGKTQSLSSDEDPKAGFSEVEKLRIQVRSLEQQNKDLRRYLDRLMVYLMEKYPDALESRKMYRF